MSRGRVLACLLGLTAVVFDAGAWFTRPPRLSPDVPTMTLVSDPDTHIKNSEASIAARYGITPGAEKRITWVGEAGTRSEYALIYLHGFSATRQEIAPVPELVAGLLNANLFETRLGGHGRETRQLDGVRAEDWLGDGAEALALGKALGDKLVVMGTSTGATIALALALARHPDFASIDSLILISPNFGPAAAGSDIATGVYGPQLMRLLLGPTREWLPANELQGKYWTTRYPTATITEMMRLVVLARELTPEATVANALLIYSPEDDVVSVDKLLQGFDALPATRKQVYRVDKPNSLSAHVLTGDILAPGTSAGTAAVISEFLAGGEP